MNYMSVNFLKHGWVIFQVTANFGNDCQFNKSFFHYSKTCKDLSQNGRAIPPSGSYRKVRHSYIRFQCHNELVSLYQG